MIKLLNHRKFSAVVRNPELNRRSVQQAITLNLCLLIILFLSLTMTSCKKDWFNAKSDINQAVPATLQDFEYLLDDFVLMNLETPGLAEVGTDGHYMPENKWSGTVEPTERNAYTWTNTLPYTNVLDWDLSYKRIFQCNLVLDGLSKISEIEDQGRFNRIKGNALFHRAKNYYDLAQIWAQPYQPISVATDIGIPLKEGIDITIPSTRSSVKQTYDQIISDLKLAADLFPDLPELKSRGSKTAVFALLARTYLAMGNYSNAGIYADSSLKLYNELIDFNSIPSTNSNMGRFNKETIFYAQRVTVWTSTWFTNWVFVEPSLYALYDNNDLRRTRFFRVTSGNIIFKGNYNSSNAGFNGLAVDEQYLIRAECLARDGNTVAAMKDLNDLLKTRWSNTVIYPIRIATDSQDALIQILLERKKELLFRNLRWSDLRRLNLDSRFITTLNRTIGGNNYILEPNSYKYTLPIPQVVLNLAPQIQQTPGW